MQNTKILCADAATENCPCVLAETGGCLICSRLRGENECGCDWAGVCVYNEFMQNGKKRALSRAEKTLRVKSVKTTSGGGFIIMELECGRGFALSCLAPGTHLFVRPAGREKYFDTPLSILSLRAEATAGSAVGASDGRAAGVITLCFRALSAKTKALAECRAGGAVIARGPYRNGIKGLPRGLSGKKVIIAAAGAGVMPGVFAAGLLASHNDVELDVADAGADELEIIRGYLPDNGSFCKGSADKFTVNFFSDYTDSLEPADAPVLPAEAMPVKALYEKFKDESSEALILLGSTGFISSVLPYARENKNAFIAVSNDSVMSCGEGVCGACGCVGKDGKRVIGCKCAESGV